MAVEREFLEIDGTINAVETISTNKIDNDSFVPLGTGCFVKSSINSKNNFLINIGAGIFVNKKTAEAVEFLEEMKTEREKLLNKIKNEFDSTMGKINDVGKEISAMQQ